MLLMNTQADALQSFHQSGKRPDIEHAQYGMSTLAISCWLQYSASRATVYLAVHGVQELAKEFTYLLR